MIWRKIMRSEIFGVTISAINGTLPKCYFKFLKNGDGSSMAMLILQQNSKKGKIAVLLSYLVLFRLRINRRCPLLKGGVGGGG
jgi:hypothetical protein